MKAKKPNRTASNNYLFDKFFGDILPNYNQSLDKIKSRPAKKIEVVPGQRLKFFRD